MQRKSPLGRKGVDRKVLWPLCVLKIDFDEMLLLREGRTDSIGI